MNTVLITGGAGFIGGNFVIKLVKKGNYKVINYDKVTYAGETSKFENIKNKPNYKFIKADICSRRAVANCIKKHKPRAIVNFAAESHVDRSIMSPSKFIRTNNLGTSVLLEEAAKYYKELSGKQQKMSFRFLQISSDEVFGELTAAGAFTENSSYNPSSPYSASKASADHLVRAW